MSSADLPPSAPAPGRRMFLAVLVLLMAFGAGVLAGVAGDRIYLLTHERIIPRRGIEFAGKQMVRRLDRSLDLSDEQEAQVQAIIGRRTARMSVSLEEVHQRFHQELSAAHAEIERLLTPEQRIKFERMRRRWRRHGFG